MHCSLLRTERKWIFFLTKLNNFRSRHLVWILHFCVKVPFLLLMQWAFSPDGRYLQTLPLHKELFQGGQGPLCSTCSQRSCEWRQCFRGKPHVYNKFQPFHKPHLHSTHHYLCQGSFGQNEAR